MLETIYQLSLETENDTVTGHVSDDLLYDLVLDELSPEKRQEALEHIEVCQACGVQFDDLQAIIAADQAVHAVWAPEIAYAAGGDEVPPIRKYPTPDGMYLVTLQPTRDGQQEQLILEATPAYQERLNGRKVRVVSSQGRIVLHGTISGGNITRLIDPKLRHEWPFRIHAG